MALVLTTVSPRVTWGRQRHPFLQVTHRILITSFITSRHHNHRYNHEKINYYNMQLCMQAFCFRADIIILDLFVDHTIVAMSQLCCLSQVEGLHRGRLNHEGS